MLLWHKTPLLLFSCSFGIKFLLLRALFPASENAVVHNFCEDMTYFYTLHDVEKKENSMYKAVLKEKSDI